MSDPFLDITAKILANIDKHGRQVMMIGADRENGVPPYCYTIGNSLRGVPEFFLVGSCDPNFAQILNAVSRIALERHLNDCDLLDLGGKFPAKVVQASAAAKTQFSPLAARFLGTDDYDLMQVLVCDTKGTFPDEAGCDPPFGNIPILRRTHS